MSATLVQLVSTTAEDVFLTSEPQFSFFKIVYHRHTDFSLELKEYLIPSNFGITSNFYLPIDGDLISKIYLQVDLPAISLIRNSIDWEIEKWKYYNIIEQPYIPYYVLQTNTVNETTVTPSINIQVKNDVGRILNSEILDRIGIGLSTIINETINIDNIFSNIINFQ